MRDNSDIQVPSCGKGVQIQLAAFEAAPAHVIPKASCQNSLVSAVQQKLPLQTAA